MSLTVSNEGGEIIMDKSMTIMYFDPEHGWQECEVKEEEHSSLAEDVQSAHQVIN